MDLSKLFRLLVVGGAVLGGTPACGPDDIHNPDEPTNDPLMTPDGGQPGSGGGTTTATGGGTGSSTGGGVNFW
jgi:hypothetical protein